MSPPYQILLDEHLSLRIM